MTNAPAFHLSHVPGQPYVAKGMPIYLVRKPGGVPEQRYVDFVYQPLLESDGTRCVLRYEPSALDRASAERLARHVECVLVSIASSPERSLAEIGLLDDVDVQRLTVDVNDTSIAFPQKTILELIAHAAVSAPTQDAVVDESGTVSYAALEARSNQLAHRLRRAGVGPDAIVGLCADRSIEKRRHRASRLFGMPGKRIFASARVSTMRSRPSRG